MALGNITVNQGTQSPILTDTVGGTAVGIVKVDISPLGAAGTIFNGTVGVSALPNIPGGTFNAGTVQLSGGTINLGTVTGNVGVSSGTVNVGTFVMPSGTLTTGTILSSGTTTGVGTVSNIGSIGMINAGTISSLPNLPQGSINVTAGTIATLGTMGTLGLVNTVTTVTNLSNGTIQNSGTVTGVGTITNIGQVYNAGTLQAGTFNVGTIVGKDANAAAQTANPFAIGGTDSGGTIRTARVDSSGFIHASVESGTFNAGTITSGTINAGTFTVTLGTVVGKDANAVAQTGNPISIGGTDSGGTVRTVLVNSAGALSVSGASSGTFVNLSTGTLNTGTVVNNGGTVLVQGVDSGGTIHTIATDTAGVQQVNLSNVAIGTFGGQDAVANSLTSGLFFTPNFIFNGATWDRLRGDTTNGGFVNMKAGVLNTGTLSPIPTIANVTYGTHGTTGVSIFGTLAGGTGSGAGTEIFITSLSLSVPSTGGSQDSSIGWGTNGGTFHAGTGLLVRGNFPAGGGIQKTFWPPVNSGTQAQLCLFQAGPGTVDVSVSYFLAISSL